jgi:hypothetical protein
MAKSFVENPFRGRNVRHAAWVCLALALLVPPASARDAALDSEPAFARAVDARLLASDISAEEHLLLRFERIFAPDLLPEDLRAADPWPAKCATSLLSEYERTRSELSPATVRQIEAYLAPARAAAEVYLTGHFRFTYALDGPDAVPAEDVAPADGVPDFVARAGAWAEAAWAAELEDAGFPQPFLAEGRVDVSFREMSAYGYTHLVAGVPAIVVHRSFADFPANDDPEGSSAGAAKVTLAHELKHASQYAASGWTEGGWLEADAVWAEDFVFDATNDYLRYLPFGSPVSDPANWMPVSYEDCLFPRCLAERYGVSLLVDFFERRAVAPSEPVLSSYDFVLARRGSSLSDAVGTLGLWSWFCGANAAGRPTGFEEADRYPTPPIAAVVTDRVTRRLAALGSEHALSTPAGRSGRPHVEFAGEQGVPFALHAITQDRDGARGFVRIPLSGAGAAAVEIPREWQDLAALVVVVTNAGVRSSAGYGLSVDGNGAVGAPDVGATQLFALHPNRPNPFVGATTISFSLPARASVRLSVYDAAGRLVRRLLERAPLDAGPHERIWDGRDQAGRLAAPGLYAYRLEADGRTATRKMLLLR